MLVSDPYRLLLVDDDPAFLDLLQTHLERAADDGVDVSTTTDPTDALAAVEDDAIDCIVSDYSMPERTGLELLAAVRARDERLPFVLLTAEGSERVASDAIDASVTSYLRKDGADSMGALAEHLLDTASDAIRRYHRDAVLDEYLSFVDTVLGALDDVIYVSSPDGTPLYWSDELRDVTGYDDANLSELTAADVVPPTHHDALEATIAAVLDGESVTVRLPLYGDDGGTTPFEFSAAPLYGDDGSVVGIAGIGRDLTERERYERAFEGLQRTAARLLEADDRTAVVDAVTDAVEYVVPVSHSVVYLVEEATERLVPAAATADIADSAPFHYDLTEDTPAVRVYHSGTPEQHAVADIDDGRERGLADAALYVPLGSHGVLVFGLEERSAPARVWTLADILATNATAALDRLERTAALRDRERALAILHARSDDFSRASDPDEVADITVEAAHDVLDAPRVAVYRWDDADGRLRPIAGDGDVPPVDASGGGRLVWEAFVDQHTVVEHDLDAERAPWPDARSAMASPLGDDGVFVAAAPDRSSFGERDAAVADLLVTNATSALERAAREADLRETEVQLRERNRDLQRLNRLNRVIRDIMGALVQADSRGSVLRAVCENLAADDRYALAWIGTLDPDVDVAAWAGEGESFLDYVIERDAEHSRARRAVESGEPVVVEDVLRDPTVADLRREAMARGFRSAITLPLRYNDTDYGVLELYAGVPDAFVGEERDVLVELAAHIANALDTVERSETLLSGGSLELEFALDDVDDPLFALARRADRTLDVDAVAPHDDAWLVYATVDGGADDVLAAAEQSVTVTDADVVRSAADTTLLAFVVSNTPVIEAFADRAATIRHIHATPDGGSVTTVVRPSTDVRAFADAVREYLPSADLSRRATPDTAATPVRHDLGEVLTDRQLETLRAAHANGYFEWPRQRTGEEVASDLGVSGPTFHQHLRKALAAVLDDVLGDPA
ncbi:GAF domain-containing protein (plasmid) [Halarchaeum sp. CBA1220]|uniref:GAF domain-containing protein n=1 Tax=Halarchaeum sp. CBA1220 TaxID=1853682 RepID=UPI000F3A93DB|nr:GAF domain-containing protein [Halarchaeum sp. CBA1220]QLC34835.1 GAF domain-containing protein [Halarchaeum sp. CBA1220]